MKKGRQRHKEENFFDKVAQVSEFFDSAIEDFKKGDFEVAIAKCDKILKLAKEHSGAMQMKIDALINLKQLEKAVKLGEELLLISPENTYTIIQLSRAYLVLENFNKVLKLVSKGLRIDANKIEFYIMGAKACFHLDKFAETIKYCDSGIKINSNLTELYLIRSWVKLSLDIYEEALSDALKAVQLNKLNINAYASLARIYGSINRVQDAIDCCTQALKIPNVNYTEIYTIRAKAYIVLNEYNKSLADCDAAIKDGANSIEVFVALLTARNGLGNFETVIKQSTNGLLLYGRSVDILYARAIAFFKSKLFKEALRDCEEILQLNGNVNEVSIIKASIHMNLHEFDKAIQTLEGALEIVKSNEEIHFMLAGAYICKGNFEKSIKHSNLALSINSKLFETYQLLLYSYVHIKDCNKAILVYKHTLSLPIEAQSMNVINLTASIAYTLRGLNQFNSGCLDPKHIRKDATDKIYDYGALGDLMIAIAINPGNKFALNCLSRVSQTIEMMDRPKIQKIPRIEVFEGVKIERLSKPYQRVIQSCNTTNTML